jgi:hypothetical protein
MVDIRFKTCTLYLGDTAIIEAIAMRFNRIHAASADDMQYDKVSLRFESDRSNMDE